MTSRLLWDAIHSQACKMATGNFLVRKFKDQYGLNRVLRVLGLSKDTWYYAQRRRKYEDKYHFLRKPLFEIARVHPEYGYRRTTAELRALGIHVNHKVIERLHSYWDLSVLKSIKHPTKNPVRILLREAGI